MREIKLIVVHCSATRAGQNIGAKELDDMHRARGFHFNPPNAAGLGHIGYHFAIRLDGTIEEGRPIDVVGAHAEGFNAKSIGVCMIGGLDKATGKAADTFTPAQWAALRGKLKALVKQFPKAKVLGHRDLSPDKNGDGKITSNEYMKECPCFNAQTDTRIHPLT